MPLEIKELSIKISIDQGSGTTGNSSAGSPATIGGEPDPALLEACVERVLETLKKQQER